MDKDSDESLWDFLRDMNPEFHPIPFYNPDGDQIEVYIKDHPSYAEVVNRFVTVFRSQETDEIVGFCITGIIPIFGLEIDQLIDMENRGYKNEKYYPKKMP